jgi:hypothetical protein
MDVLDNLGGVCRIHPPKAKKTLETQAFLVGRGGIFGRRQREACGFLVLA